MMKFQKSPPELEQLFLDAFPDDSRAERKKMFGYPAGFVNGNMFCGLWQDQVHVRLGDADRQRATELGAEPFTPMGRLMKGYMSLPPAIVNDRGQFREWLGRGLAYTASLPPKEQKSKASKASKATTKPTSKPKK